MKTTTLEFDLTLYEWELIIYALRAYSAHNREHSSEVDELCKYITDRVQTLIDFHRINPA